MRAAAKRELRSRLSAARGARSAHDIDEARAAVRAAVLDRCDKDGWRCVAAYVPLRTEPGSSELLAGLVERGVRVLVPVLLPDRDLDWARWSAAGSVAGPEGTWAIAEAHAVLVPALAVAADGIRLGRGGGSYDRALSRADPHAPRVALLYDDELVEALPQEPWDLPVTAIVTPSGWLDLPTG
ncbi:MAG: 5-formyltetrahydrofolate cyclo-ligase [Jatrophihabitantaceae bacterium]